MNREEIWLVDLDPTIDAEQNSHFLLQPLLPSAFSAFICSY